MADAQPGQVGHEVSRIIQGEIRSQLQAIGGSGSRGHGAPGVSC
ncbi:hypothetical protein [Ectothiorhodospira haloalkaliphila]|nr:hypothetical protein [Ectothiorhodospira haloalkaliphila]